jgi:hypothetical protein
MSFVPPGRPPKVDHIREDFLEQIDAARRLVDAVVPLERINGAGGLHPKHVYRSVELAFMGVCASWEDFLEATMVRYLANAQTDSGRRPTLRLGSSQDIAHSYQLLSGKPDYDPEDDYMAWTNPIAVTKLAKVFFTAGHPYAVPLTAANDPLKQAVRIRNRIAHGSELCKAQYHKAANTIRRLPEDEPLGQGHRAGALLRETAGPFFGAAIPAANITVFEAYMLLFERLARSIVP